MPARITIFLGLIFMRTAPSVAASAQASAPIAVTELGDLLGRWNGGGAEWLGVPYATAERWKPPVDWSASYPFGGRDASKYGATCPQLPNVEGPVYQDEDCLFLNVHAPARNVSARAALMPIMAFIHGGGFTVGSVAPMYGGLFGYSATELSEKQNVISVALQYRLGVLGWLPIRGANLGLQDQQSALRWVQRHAIAFGGNSAAITLFGQSAGSISVCVHLVAPTSAPLFARAILESGPCEATELVVAKASVRAFEVATQCSTETCLETINVSSLLAAQGSVPLQLGPIVDGQMLPAQPMELIAGGEWARIPVMLGTATYEAFWSIIYDGEGSLWPSGKPMPASVYATALTGLCAVEGACASPADVERLLHAYPPQAGDNLEPFAAAATDGLFLCPTRRIAQLLSQTVSDVFMYHWDWRVACKTWEQYYPLDWNVSHSSELPFLFDFVHNCTESSADVIVKASAQGLWGAFARQAAPGCDGDVCWPMFGEGGGQALRIGDFGTKSPTLSIESAAHGRPCDIWDAGAVPALFVA